MKGNSHWFQKILPPPHVIALVLAAAASLISGLVVAVGVDETLRILAICVPLATNVAAYASIGVLAFIVSYPVCVLCSHRSTRLGTICCATLIIVASVLGSAISSWILRQGDEQLFVINTLTIAISIFLGIFGSYFHRSMSEDAYIPLVPLTSIEKIMITEPPERPYPSFSEIGLGLVLASAGSIRRSRFVLASDDPRYLTSDDPRHPSLIIFDKLRCRTISDSAESNAITIKRLTAAGYQIEGMEWLDELSAQSD